MDWPGITPPNTLPIHIGTFSRFSALWEMQAQIGNIGGAANVTWLTANKAVYVPVWLPYPYPVRRVWWNNGSSVASNADFGIYDDNGSKVYSTGSTARTGLASITQYVTPSTEFILEPGRYFFAIAVSATTANTMQGGASGTLNRLRMVGIMEQASALPLPTTATFAAVTGTQPYPQCGICRLSAGF